MKEIHTAVHEGINYTSMCLKEYYLIMNNSLFKGIAVPMRVKPMTHDATNLMRFVSWN